VITIGKIILQKKLNVNFRLQSTVNVEHIIKSFPRMHEGHMDDLKSMAVYAISQHYYALTEKMAYWQDFKLLKEQYFEFIKSAKLEPETQPNIPLNPKIAQLKEKIPKERKEKGIKKEETGTSTSTEVTTKLTFVDNYSQTQILTYKNTPSQTEIESSEMKDMIEANIPNLLNTVKKLTRQLDLGKSDHAFEMSDLKEGKDKEIMGLIREHKNDVDTYKKRD